MIKVSHKSESIDKCVHLKKQKKQRAQAQQTKIDNFVVAEHIQEKLKVKPTTHRPVRGSLYQGWQPF